MPPHLNTVKTPPHPGRYHHGDLRQALVAAAEAVIAERGADGFSLREAARRAGVSPAAPQHHFGDVRGLLTAVAVTGFTALAEAQERAERAAPDAPGARLYALGVAYVDFALAHPAHFDVMWRTARLDGDDPAYQAASRRAFAPLAAAVAGVPTADAPDTAPADADPRALACWATVHGFARLALDGAFGPGPAGARAAADALLPAVLGCLQG